MAGLIIYAAGALATWRLSRMVTEEEGPFEIFTRLRDRFSQGGKWGWVGRGLYCLWCVSFWVGLMLALPFYGLSFSAVLVGLSWSSLSILFNAVVDIVLLEISKRQQ